MTATRPFCAAREACQAKGGGHCRPCWGRRLRELSLADPEKEARRRVTVAAALARYQQKRLADPAYRRKLAESARAHNVLQRPEVRAKTFAPGVRERSEATRIARVRAMTPEERRRRYGAGKGFRSGLSGPDLELFNRLRLKEIPAAEARAMVDEEARRSVARTAADMRARHEHEKAQRY